MTAAPPSSRVGVPHRELRAWFAIGVLVFALGVAIYRYVTITAGTSVKDIPYVGGDPWMAGDWLINYAGGFVRRGLFGDLFLRLGPGGETGLWVLLAIQVAIYLVVLAYSVRALHRADYSWSSIALVCSPAALAFVGYVLSADAAFRKELLSFLVLALLAWSRGRNRSGPGVVALVIAALAAFVLAVFSWEASALTLPAIGYLLLHRGAPQPQLDVFRRSAAAVFLVVGALGALLSVVYHGDPATAIAICDALRAAGFDGPSLCSGGEISGGGAIEAIGWTSYKTGQDLGLALPVYIGFLPMIVLSLVPAVASRWFRANWLWGLAIIVAILPLYVVVTDYGRWTHLMAMALMFCITADDPADAHSRIWNPLSGILYVGTWGMPHWMGQAQFEESWWPNVSLLSKLTETAIDRVALQFSPILPNPSGETIQLAQRFLFGQPASGWDSWGTMQLAMQYLNAGGKNLYQDVLLTGGIKFQYFPTSLLFVEPAYLFSPKDIAWPMNTLGWLLVVGTGVVLFKLLVHLAVTLRGGERLPAWGHTGLLAVAFLATVTYRPLLWAWDLGQAQVEINFLCALALYAYLRGNHPVSGVALALAALIKPQLGLFLLWGLVRKEWKFSAWLAGTAAAGVLVSVARYGLQVHLDYLPILSLLSRHGEAYYPNQSVSGLLHRFLMTTDFVRLDFTRFPPYNETVYLGSTIATIVFIALPVAVGFVGRSHARAARYSAPSVKAGVDFGLSLACFTMASPIAWDHHYGLLLPAYAVTVAAALQLRTRVAIPVLGGLALSYLLTATELYPFFLPWARTPANLALSYVFFGAVLLIMCMLVTRFARPRDAEPAPVRTADRSSQPALARA